MNRDTKKRSDSFEEQSKKKEENDKGFEIITWSMDMWCLKSSQIQGKKFVSLYT